MQVDISFLFGNHNSFHMDIFIFNEMCYLQYLLQYDLIMEEGSTL